MNYKKLIGIIIITLIIGTLPSLFVNMMGMNIDNLTKPALYPPNILFPIVWTILYILMSISVFLATKDNNEPYTIYVIQLIVNALWTVIFFGFDFKLLGFIWILFLIVLVAIMIYKFYKENKLAAFLQIPYLLWLMFAAYLNMAIYLLNR